LGGYIAYDYNEDKVFEVDKNKEIDELKHQLEEISQKEQVVTPEKTEVKYSTGHYASIVYTEEYAYYVETVYSEGSNELIGFEVDLGGKKIKEAQIMNGVMSTDAAESAVFIMEDNTVKIAYITQPLDNTEKRELRFIDYEPLEGVKVSKINKITSSVGHPGAKTICDVILVDGTNKIIEN